MDKKYFFDSAVLTYEKRRPDYGTEIYKDIIKYAGISEDKSLLEIGCGTGKATEPFLKTGCEVTAIELGENLAAYTREKFKEYKNLKVLRCAFEDYACEDNMFDMLYSATAFHWIPDEIGYKKAYNIIKRGGTLALFWNRPSPNDRNDPIHQRIQAVYRRLLPQWSYKAESDENKESKYSSTINKMEQYGFTHIEAKLYHNTRKMNGAEYIELLNTYSDHMALEPSIKSQLFDGVRAAIEELGDEMLINDTVELYLGKKD